MAEKLISAEFTKRLAERLIKDEEECYNTSPKSWAEEIENFKHLIDSIPAVEAKPVVHAHWKYYWDCNCDNYSYCCSYCGKDALTKEETMYDQVLTKFCPYCGAQMNFSEEKDE